jgi:iron-sulfur cluster repair protein YtfE (RIC family)
MDYPTLDTSVPDWVIEYPQLLRLFEELRIDYSCGGKSLEFACRERGLAPCEVLTHLENVLVYCGEADLRDQ